MMMSCSNHSSNIQQKSMNSENPSSAGGSRKTGLKPPEQALNCPRCDSPNTKFCYYNNYSLTQPRHFCKTCRRYWTKGGALRNVPIGGGCRKSKKIRSSSSRLSSDSRDSPASSDNGTSHQGLNFFHVPSHQSSMEFQLGSGGGSASASGINPFSSRNGIFSNPFLTYGDISSTPPPPPPPPVINPSCFDIDGLASSGSLMGFNFTGNSLSPSASAFNGGGGGILQDMGTSAVVNIQSSNNIATSIESLSCLNQDLHWKLQQQRLGMIFGGGGVGGDQISTQNHHHHHYKDRNISSSVVVGGHHHDLHGIQTEKPQPILFGNLEISKQEEEEEEGKKAAAAAACTTTTTATTTEWFFEQPYNTPRNTTTTNNIINSGGGGGGGGGGQGNENTTTASSPWINGSIHHQAWINSTGLNHHHHHHHHHQYSSALPHE